MAFKHVEICLTEPICTCDKQNLSWNIYFDGNERASIHIFCKKCRSKLIVPHDKFVASFKLDKPYPKPYSDDKKSEEKENQPPPQDPFFLHLEAEMDEDKG